ncbi:MAG: ABC transporter substrate-binding protein [Bacteroidetes bacterium]|nr:ABC transporter substrate-binding protein [Bacteroidota bacterium]
MLRFTIPSVRQLAVLFASVLMAGVFWACQKSGDGEETQHKRWKLTMIKYEEMRQTEDAEKGFRSGLADAGLREGIDFEIVSRNAQGDIPTVLTMLDAVSVDGTDMLVSLQTPTLHAAVKRGAGIPLVFMVVANPFVISSVGSGDSTHLPYLTGVYTYTTFDRMLRYIKACIPNVHRIGTLHATAELNSTFYKNELLTAGQRAGLEVELVGVQSKASIKQATQELCDMGVDAIVQIEDNLTSATFPTIMKVANENKVPVFSFVNEQAKQGAVMVVAPDYIRGARTAASYAARIIKGQRPLDIPFGRIDKFDLIINMDAANKAGVPIPADIIDQADEVLRSDK